MAQTSQSAQPTAARAGMIRGDLNQFTFDGTRVAEVAIAAGLFVSKGSAVDKCKLPTSAAEVQGSGLGFAMLDTAAQTGSVTVASPVASTEYQIGDGVPTVTRGPFFWAIAAEALLENDPVFVCYGATSRGKIYNDAQSAGTASAQLYGARVERAQATIGGPVLISLAIALDGTAAH